jgi:predicted GNAT family acetyltransferase
VPFYPHASGLLAGVAFGTAVVFVAERTVVPEWLRGDGI